jgi:hypothetical protein
MLETNCVLRDARLEDLDRSVPIMKLVHIFGGLEQDRDDAVENGRARPVRHEYWRNLTCQS